MARNTFSCGCLNVKICVSQSATDNTTVHEEEFRQLRHVFVPLSAGWLDSVSIKYPQLTTTKQIIAFDHKQTGHVSSVDSPDALPVKDRAHPHALTVKWLVTLCKNCDLACYAVSAEDMPLKRIIMPVVLFQGEDMSTLERDDDYSASFGIVIHRSFISKIIAASEAATNSGGGNSGGTSSPESTHSPGSARAIDWSALSEQAIRNEEAASQRRIEEFVQNEKKKVEAFKQRVQLESAHLARVAKIASLGTPNHIPPSSTGVTANPSPTVSTSSLSDESPHGGTLAVLSVRPTAVPSTAELQHHPLTNVPVHPGSAPKTGMPVHSGSPLTPGNITIISLLSSHSNNPSAIQGNSPITIDSGSIASPDKASSHAWVHTASPNSLGAPSTHNSDQSASSNPQQTSVPIPTHSSETISIVANQVPSSHLASASLPVDMHIPSDQPDEDSTHPDEEDDQVFEFDEQIGSVSKRPYLHTHESLHVSASPTPQEDEPSELPSISGARARFYRSQQQQQQQSQLNRAKFALSSSMPIQIPMPNLARSVPAARPGQPPHATGLSSRGTTSQNRARGISSDEGSDLDGMEGGSLVSGASTAHSNIFSDDEDGKSGGESADSRALPVVSPSTIAANRAANAAMRAQPQHKGAKPIRPPHTLSERSFWTTATDLPSTNRVYGFTPLN